MAAMTSPGSRFRPGQGKWCYPHATYGQWGISTTTVGYKTESEYADSGGAEGHPPTRHDVTRRWSQGGLERSGLPQGIGHINAGCHPAPFSMFPTFLSFLFPTRSFLRKDDPGSSRTKFLPVRQGGISPWPNLNSTPIDDSDDDRSGTVSINRICGKRTSDSDLITPVEGQNSRDNKNVAPKTQPRPPRPHPKLLLRLHANRPARRRPRRSHHSHTNPLRQRPPTPLLRIRHLQRSRPRPRPQALLLFLRLTPPPPPRTRATATAAVQTPTTNVPNTNPHPRAGIPSPRRRGACEAGGGSGVLL